MTKEVKEKVKEIQQAANEGESQRLYESITGNIDGLVKNFVQTDNKNKRMGGLCGLAATAVGLNTEARGSVMVEPFLPQLIPPVLRCFQDQDTRVRCHAVETLYNIAKVARQHTLPFFNDIFRSLATLYANNEDKLEGDKAELMNNAKLVHQLMKDHVTAYADTFDVPAFIPVVSDLLVSKLPHVRNFLIEWIKVLHDVPDIDILSHLPEFLEGVFSMLADKRDANHELANAVLKDIIEDLKLELLSGGVEQRTFFLPKLMPPLSRQLRSAVTFRRATALQWIADFIELSQDSILFMVDQILDAYLPAHSEEQTILEWAQHIDALLKGIIKKATEPLDYPAIVQVLVKHLINATEAAEEFQTSPWVTKVAVIKWIDRLFLKDQNAMRKESSVFFGVVVSNVAADYEEVAWNALQFLITMAKSCSDEFSPVLQAVVEAFRHNEGMLDRHGSGFIRHLGKLLGAEAVYRAFAEIVVSIDDISFNQKFIQVINELLLTAVEYRSLQEILRQGLQNPHCRELFNVLYPSWCYNAVATVSLCLLTSAYSHSSELLRKFGSIAMNVDRLVQLDRLVLLLESPAFTFLRLQLLEPHQNPDLIKSLYGIMMLLPQTDAYNKLKGRLDCLNILCLLPKSDGPANTSTGDVDFSAMSERFDHIQQRVTEHTTGQSPPGPRGTKLLHD